MTTFLLDVASSLVSKFGLQLSEIEIVAPSRRAIIFLRNHLSKTLNVSSLPKLYSINDWISLRSQVANKGKIPSQYILLYHLYECYLDIPNFTTNTLNPPTFDDFLRTGEQILSDFDLIDRYLINPSELYEKINDSNTIKDFFSKNSIEIEETSDIFLHLDKADHRRRLELDFSQRWKSFIELYELFNRRLSDLNLAYSGKKYKELALYLDSGITADSVSQTTVFVGLNALSRSEKLILAAKQRLAPTYFIWDYDSRWNTNNDFCEASYFIDKNIKQFPQAQFFENQPHSAHKIQKIESIGVASNIIQCKVVNKLLSEGDFSNLTTAIVLTDESIAIPLLRSISHITSNLNISIGFPFNYSTIGQLFSSLFSLIKSSRKFENSQSVSFKTSALTEFVSNQVIRSLNPDNVAFEGKGTYLTIEAIIADFPNLRELLPDSILVGSNFFSFINSFIINIQDYIVSLEDKYIIKKVVEKLKTDADTITFFFNKDLSLGFSISLIESSLSTLRIDFQGTSGSTIEVIGILESRTLDFDRVIMLNIEEGSFPKPTPDNSFIPLSLYPQFGLPTVAEKSAIWSYYFYRLLSRSQVVSLLYSNTSTQQTTGEPSRYIQQLRHSSNYNIIDRTVSISTSRHGSFGDSSVVKSTEILEKISKLCLSPSSISRYLNCPISFYYRYIVELYPERPPLDPLSPLLSGNLIHNTLHRLYTPFIDTANVRQLIAKISSEQIENTIKNLCFEEFGTTEMIDTEYFKLAAKQVQRQVQNIITFDCSDNSANLSRILSLESSYSTEIKSIKIYGKIDRIDTLSDGSLRIVDYKSSAPNLNSPDISSAFERHYLTDKQPISSAIMQLLVYSFLVSNDIGNDKKIKPVIFNSRGRENVELPLKTISSLTLSDDEIQSVGEVLTAVIEEIKSPDIGFMHCQFRKNCESCDYSHICSR